MARFAIVASEMENKINRTAKRPLSGHASDFPLTLVCVVICESQILTGKSSG